MWRSGLDRSYWQGREQELRSLSGIIVDFRITFVPKAAGASVECDLGNYGPDPGQVCKA